MQPPTSAAGDDKYCGAAAGGGARGWLLGGGCSKVPLRAAPLAAPSWCREARPVAAAGETLG